MREVREETGIQTGKSHVAQSPPVTISSDQTPSLHVWLPPTLQQGNRGNSALDQLRQHLGVPLYWQGWTPITCQNCECTCRIQVCACLSPAAQTQKLFWTL